METKNEESRIAVIGIVVEQEASVDVLNETLHEYREYIIGRMGIPYREKKVNIISIAIDAPQDKISAYQTLYTCLEKSATCPASSLRLYILV